MLFVTEFVIVYSNLKLLETEKIKLKLHICKWKTIVKKAIVYQVMNNFNRLFDWQVLLSLHISKLCVVYLCIFIYFTSCPRILFRSKFFIVYSNSFFSGNSTEMVKTDVAYCRVKDNWWIMHCIKSYKLKRDVKLVDLPIMSNTKRC